MKLPIRCKMLCGDPAAAEWNSKKSMKFYFHKPDMKMKEITRK